MHALQECWSQMIVILGKTELHSQAFLHTHTHTHTHTHNEFNVNTLKKYLCIEEALVPGVMRQ